jgi:hypothetical protein
MQLLPAALQVALFLGLVWAMVSGKGLGVRFRGLPNTAGGAFAGELLSQPAASHGTSASCWGSNRTAWACSVAPLSSVGHKGALPCAQAFTNICCATTAGPSMRCYMSAFNYAENDLASQQLFQLLKLWHAVLQRWASTADSSAS